LARKYDASSITVLQYPEDVRAKPSMYIGETDASGTLQCFQEILNNATDEVSECGGGRVSVTIDGNKVVVVDDGRGIPIDVHKKTKKPAIETVLTHLSAGGKIAANGGKTAYGASTIGVHGVGASVVNALADYMNVWTYRGGWHQIQFKRGIVVGKLQKSRKPKWAKVNKGTIVEYVLDSSIMKGALDTSAALRLCDIVRHFLPTTIEFNGKVLEPRSPTSLLKRILKNEENEFFIDPVAINANGVRFVGCWTNATDTKIDAHVAGAVVPSGTHVKGLEDAVRDSVLSVCPREAKGSNVLVGFRAVLDVLVDAPSFSGQVKTNLRTASARAQVVSAVQKELTKHLKKHKVAVQKMLEHATRISAIDAQYERNKQLAKAAGGKGKLSLPEGLIAATSHPPERRELFLCEGKSAKGSLKMAKMPWQEVLALRGKMANVINKKGAVENSKAVGDILAAIGYDPRKPVQKPRVGKVVLLTDADDDGDHISVLLLTVFQQVMPTLLKEKRVYFVELPLFEARTSKGEAVTGDNLAEMERRHGKLSSVNRMKGLAGCEVALLRRFAADPATRRWVQVAAPSAKEAAGLVSLMGADSSARKKLLSSQRGSSSGRGKHTGRNVENQAGGKPAAGSSRGDTRRSKHSR
jgi:DNA gyrase/topoisomerase IV subunit B